MKLDPEFLQTKVLRGCWHSPERDRIVFGGGPNANRHACCGIFKYIGSWRHTFDNPNDFDLLRRRFIELDIFHIFDRWLVKHGCGFIFSWEQRDWADKCLYMQQFAMERPELFNQ